MAGDTEGGTLHSWNSLKEQSSNEWVTEVSEDMHRGTGIFVAERV